MTNNKEIYPQWMSDKTADIFSKKQQHDQEKSQPQHHPIEDKRKEVRKEHTNGSTPSKRL
jgi:hypothetical protein